MVVSIVGIHFVILSEAKHLAPRAGRLDRRLSEVRA
jgi:hypothetical protein